MYLLNSKNRSIGFSAAALVLLLAIVWLPWTGNAQAPEKPASNGEAAQEPDPGLEPRSDDEPEELPDIRRRPPRTDVEEQRYKLFKYQTDPFLMPPPPRAGSKAYNPFDWLVACDRSDISTYLVQDKTGAVIGNLTITTEPVEGGPAGSLVRLTLKHDYRQPMQINILVRPLTLEPVGYRRWLLDSRQTGNADATGEQPAGRLITLDTTPGFTVDYQFDRVNVERNDAGFISRARFRQLPYAFDQSSIHLLVRQLDFRNSNWPFEAAVTDPLQQASRQLLIVKPNRVSTMSAEPRTYNCFELSVQLDNTKSRWWVERILPNRLVKFTQGDLTYTLVQHLEQ